MFIDKTLSLKKLYKKIMCKNATFKYRMAWKRSDLPKIAHN